MPARYEIQIEDGGQRMKLNQLLEDLEHHLRTSLQVLEGLKEEIKKLKKEVKE